VDNFDIHHTMCISCVTAFDTHQISSLMALPQWLSIAFSIADFVVQRVDRVGPVSFEPPEKQPPEHAAETVDAPKVDTSVDEAPPAEVDRAQSSFGFQAGGGGGPSPSGGDGGGGSGNGDNGDDSSARAGGGGEPSSGGDPGNEDDDDDDGDGSAQLARAGGSTEPSSNEEDDDDDDNGNGSAKLARAGGGNDPTPAPPPEPPDDNGGDQNVVQCSFRAMRPGDQHSRYQVEKARDDAGEERPA